MPPIWMNLHHASIWKRGVDLRLLSGCVLHLEGGIYLDHDQHLDESGSVTQMWRCFIWISLSNAISRRCGGNTKQRTPGFMASTPNKTNTCSIACADRICFHSASCRAIKLCGGSGFIDAHPAGVIWKWGMVGTTNTSKLHIICHVCISFTLCSVPGILPVQPAENTYSIYSTVMCLIIVCILAYTCRIVWLYMDRCVNEPACMYVRRYVGPCAYVFVYVCMHVRMSWIFGPSWSEIKATQKLP